MQSSRLLSPDGVSQDMNNIVTSPLTHQDPNDLLLGDVHFVRGQLGTVWFFSCSLETSFTNENQWMFLFTKWLFFEWAGIVQSVERFATGWTVRGSNPGGARFSAPVQTGPGAHPASYTMGIGSFPGESGRGVAWTTHHHLAPWLRKEQSYTSTPPLGLRGLF